MLYNSVKVALRVLVRHRTTTAINILGLSLALAVCTLVGVYVEHEWGFDGFHGKADRIYVVWERLTMAQMAQPQQMTRTTPAVEEAARTGVSGVERVAKVASLSGGVVGRGETVKLQGAAVDREFFEVFDFPLKRGDPATVLVDPRSIVLSAEAAATLFGGADPVGQSLTMSYQGFSPVGRTEPMEVDLTVTGVLAPIPANSSVRPQMLAPLTLLESVPRTGGMDKLYLLLSQGADPVRIEEALTATARTSRDLPGAEVNMHLMPLREMHWTEELIMGLASRGRAERVYALLAVGALILLIACINFANLGMARATMRTLEIGVRKSVGAHRGQLVRQFVGEAVLVSGISMAVGSVVVQLLLPGFAALVDAQLSFDPWSPPVLAAMLLLTVAVGLAAGIYPAVVAAHFEPVRALANRLRAGRRNWLGSGMICLQFAISSLLVIGTLTVERQIDYMRTKDLGFDGDQVAAVSAGLVTDLELERLQNALQGGHVVSVAGASPAPGWGRRPHVWDADGTRIEVRSFAVSPGFVKTLGLRPVAGRDFSQGLAGDRGHAIVVNETMAAILGAGALGMEVRGISHFDEPLTVVGIVGDFHTDPMREPIAPGFIHLARPGEMGPGITYFNVLARCNKEDIRLGMAELKQAAATVWPDRQLDVSFLEESFAKRYWEEERWARAFAYASGFAIGIACMGLLGLTALSVARRTKEIGIRRVLGATIGGLLVLLSSELMWLVLIGNAVAWPLAWVGSRIWLESFAYRMDPDPWLFATAAAGLLGIALLTIAGHVVRTARTQPVEALRYE